MNMFDYKLTFDTYKVGVSLFLLKNYISSAIQMQIEVEDQFDAKDNPDDNDKIVDYFQDNISRTFVPDLLKSFLWPIYEPHQIITPWIYMFVHRLTKSDRI